MNLRLYFKTTSLATLAIILGLSLGCGMIGRPKISNPLTVSTTPDPIAAAPKLRTSDSISIRLDMVTEQKEHLKIVDEYGNIELPLVGKFKVLGMTQTLLQDEIYKRYVPRFYAYMTVTVQLQTPRVIYLTGEARAPAALPFRDDMTVLRVIMGVGGFTEFADKRHVILTRGDRQMVIDCVEIDRHPEKDIPVLPGDTIKVPRTLL